jgi:hypothetical protein
VLAVGVLLGFAGLFLADAAQANQTYDALALHRVEVQGQVVGCFDVQAGRLTGYGEQSCRVVYQYKGYQFSAQVGSGQSRSFYVDPLDTSDRMNAGTFANGPTEITGDIVIAVLLLTGAALVTALHQIHLYRRRRRTPQGRPHVHQPG